LNRFRPPKRTRGAAAATTKVGMETTKIWVSASVIHSEASPSNFQGSQITAADPETNRLLLLQYNKSELYFELLN
jgi:hypothetical protein